MDMVMLVMSVTTAVGISVKPKRKCSIFYCRSFVYILKTKIGNYIYAIYDYEEKYNQHDNTLRKETFFGSQVLACL